MIFTRPVRKTERFLLLNWISAWIIKDRSLNSSSLRFSLFSFLEKDSNPSLKAFCSWNSVRRTGFLFGNNRSEYQSAQSQSWASWTSSTSACSTIPRHSSIPSRLRSPSRRMKIWKKVLYNPLVWLFSVRRTWEEGSCFWFKTGDFLEDFSSWLLWLFGNFPPCRCRMESGLCGVGGKHQLRSAIGCRGGRTDSHGTTSVYTARKGDLM